MIDAGAAFTRRLLRWYDRSRRDLPWRTSPQRPGPLDPYHVLVSETMLQQTQVATVIPYFNRFIARFPTLADLASAPLQEVLRLWQGLGYYSRAHNLQAAAAIIVNKLGGQFPSQPAELSKLHGIGRYTAGAVASIAFNRRAAILDGNVARVLCRLDRIEEDPRILRVREGLWTRAGKILPRERVGDFNSALMELGATVCTPKQPQCLLCPVRRHCQAFANGRQDQIPAPRKSRPTRLLRRKTYCISWKDRWLIEQRPAVGRWAGMWQFVTVDAVPDRAAVLPVKIGPAVQIGTISHTLTHRRYEFAVFRASAVNGSRPRNDRPRLWATLDELDQYPLPRPHLKVVEMLKSQ